MAASVRSEDRCHTGKAVDPQIGPTYTLTISLQEATLSYRQVKVPGNASEP